jgi:hypothetical protein
MMANTNVASNPHNVVSWDVTPSVLTRLANIPGRPVLNGTYLIAGGSPPASIVTTAITSVATNQADNLYLRIDG